MMEFVRKRGAPRSLASCARGNVGIIFALSLAPIMIAAGSAFDYSDASRVRDKLQAASDAAALAGDAASPWTVGACEDQAMTFFQSNAPEALFETAPTAVIDCAETGTTVSATGRVRTSVMNVVGLSGIEIEAFSKTSCRIDGGGSGSGAPLMWRQGTAVPTMTRIVTLGQFQNGTARYMITPDGRPIVRIDNPHDGPATITIRTHPNPPQGNVSFDVPTAGQFIVVMPWAPAGQVTFFVDGGPEPRSRGSATWNNANRLETRIEDIRGTPVHQASGDRTCWMSE